jgi:hypothetical protein
MAGASPRRSQDQRPTSSPHISAASSSPPPYWNPVFISMKASACACAASRTDSSPTIQSSSRNSWSGLGDVVSAFPLLATPRRRLRKPVIFGHTGCGKAQEMAAPTSSNRQAALAALIVEFDQNLAELKAPGIREWRGSSGFSCLRSPLRAALRAGDRQTVSHPADCSSAFQIFETQSYDRRFGASSGYRCARIGQHDRRVQRQRSRGLGIPSFAAARTHTTSIRAIRRTNQPMPRLDRALAVLCGENLSRRPRDLRRVEDPRGRARIAF